MALNGDKLSQVTVYDLQMNAFDLEINTTRLKQLKRDRGPPDAHLL